MAVVYCIGVVTEAGRISPVVTKIEYYTAIFFMYSFVLFFNRWH